jgi:hypothetical protein
MLPQFYNEVLMQNRGVIWDERLTDDGWNLGAAKTETERLIAPGVVGFYNQFEATEVFATESERGTPVNVFSILVAEDRLDDQPQPARYVNPQRIKLSRLKGWTFGIKRYSRRLDLTGGSSLKATSTLPCGVSVSTTPHPHCTAN